MAYSKDNYRQQILRLRGALTSQEIMQKGSDIHAQLFELDEFKKSQVLMCYVTYKNEVPTERIITHALNLKKKIAVPVVLTNKKQLKASLVYDLNELKPGAYSILEPSKRKIISPSQLELVIVPGTVFDRRGFRIGYGGGYYDRFLANLNPEITTVGLAFELQLVERIPQHSHDVALKKIVTEKRVIECTS